MAGMRVGWAVWIALSASGLGQGATTTPGRRMADAVVAKGPMGKMPAPNGPGRATDEEGMLLDGMTAEWRATGDARYFQYGKETVGSRLASGTTGIVPAAGDAAEQPTMGDVQAGEALLTLYRVTLDAKYYQAAKYVREQLRAQKTTVGGGFGHKDADADPVWLEGAPIAGPFLAEYGATFQEPEDFDEVASELLGIDARIREPGTRLTREGSDQPRQPDKATARDRDIWSRTMGRYAMALVDVLDWIPEGHPRRRTLVAALQRTAAAIVRNQDPGSWVWRQGMNEGGRAGNFPESSASAMFVYALAKGVRMGYLPQADEASAGRGWEGIQKWFLAAGSDGMVSLGGRVKAGGPHRPGSFDPSVHEPMIADDAEGVGVFLMAASEMEQASTEAKAQGKTVLVDAWFNSQTRVNAAGQRELFHYKWDDDSNNGFSFFGRMFQRYGMRLAEEKTAPTAEDLKKAQVYVFASPDIPSKNPKPNYMDARSVEVIAAWVKTGGVLVLMQNDGPNAEFTHFDTLGDRFGIHFNPVLRNHVVGEDKTPGLLTIPAGTGGIFRSEHHTYMKDTCTISVSGGAKAILVDKGDAMMAVSHYGKGTVYAVVDPWLYNEYTDGRNVASTLDTFAAGVELAGWLAGLAR